MASKYQGSPQHKTIKIGQAHLLNNMSEEKLKVILAKHGLIDSDWTGVTTDTLDAIIDEVAEIVHNAHSIS